LHFTFILKKSSFSYNLRRRGFFMYVYYQPNPCGKSVGDCTVRALSKALNLKWEDAYLILVAEGLRACEMPSANAVWGEVLRRRGFKKRILPTTCPNCMTVRQFCEEYERGVYVIGTGNHAVAAIDGDYYDSWDSGNEVVAYFWEM
jgi:hypothetical protein